MHRKLFTTSDASVGLDDLFKSTELTKFRERSATSHLLNLRVFPLGSFYLFFSTCDAPPCLLEQDGVLVPGSFNTPVVIEFSDAGTLYGELGGSMHEANFSFSHEDPHDLAILVLARLGEVVFRYLGNWLLRCWLHWWHNLGDF